MNRLRRLIAFVRFRGWRNDYWREDFYMDECPHDGATYQDHTTVLGSSTTTYTYTLCVGCGCPLP